MPSVWDVELHCFDGPLKSGDGVVGRFIARTQWRHRPDENVLAQAALAVYFERFPPGCQGGFYSTARQSFKQLPARAADWTAKEFELWFVARAGETDDEGNLAKPSP